VAIKTRPDDSTYAKIIKQSRKRESVDLKQLGITNPRLHKVANGSVLIEVSKGVIKADSLVSRLREVIGEKAVITRPVVKGEVRISRFDKSIMKDEIISIVTDIGGCLASDIRWDF